MVYEISNDTHVILEDYHTLLYGRIPYLNPIGAEAIT